MRIIYNATVISSTCNRKHRASLEGISLLKTLDITRSIGIITKHEE